MVVHFSFELFAKHMFNIENSLCTAQHFDLLLATGFYVEKTGPSSLLLVGYVYKMFCYHFDIVCLENRTL